MNCFSLSWCPDTNDPNCTMKTTKSGFIIYLIQHFIDATYPAEKHEYIIRDAV